MGKNAKALRRCYTDLFGWNMSKAAAYDYWMIDTGGEGAIGGIGPSTAGGLEGGRGFATFKVDVDDIKAVLSKAEALGGKTVLSARAIPDTNFTIAYLADPEGHVIGLTHDAANLLRE
jgi:predicted enzyme related to lactoylglutathione lyase